MWLLQIWRKENVCQNVDNSRVFGLMTHRKSVAVAWLNEIEWCGSVGFGAVVRKV